MDIDPNKVMNTVVIVIGSALIGYGFGSLAIGIGVFCIAFVFLPTN